MGFCFLVGFMVFSVVDNWWRVALDLSQNPKRWIRISLEWQAQFRFILAAGIQHLAAPFVNSQKQRATRRQPLYPVNGSGLEFFRQTSLLQNSVGCESGLDIGVYSEIDISNWAVPDFVVAPSLTNESAFVVFEDSF
jgi:hypothetical protein